MTGPLTGKHIVLGVSGSIASYKAAEIASRLVQEGAVVATTNLGKLFDGAVVRAMGATVSREGAIGIEAWRLISP